MANALQFAKKIEEAKPTDIIRLEEVQQQFINVYNSCWKEGGGEQVYEREAVFFNQQLRDKKELRECTSLSIFYAFIDLAVRGLTLAPGAQALCYLLSRKIKIGKNEQGYDLYEKVCSLAISGYGELTLRARAGQISHADNPVIVYEGDTFQYGESNGQKFVNYSCCYPRKSMRIIACFIKITRIDGSIDYSVMTEPDWLRLKQYSEKNNSYFDKVRREFVKGDANALYTSALNGQIDPGFLIAKCIKHAFKSYPRIPVGKGTVLQSDIVDTPEQEPDFNPYGIQEPANNLPNPGAAQEQSFGPQDDLSGGVKIDLSAESADDGTF